MKHYVMILSQCIIKRMRGYKSSRSHMRSLGGSDYRLHGTQQVYVASPDSWTEVLLVETC